MASPIPSSTSPQQAGNIFARSKVESKVEDDSKDIKGGKKFSAVIDINGQQVKIDIILSKKLKKNLDIVELSAHLRQTATKMAAIWIMTSRSLSDLSLITLENGKRYTVTTKDNSSQTHDLKVDPEKKDDISKALNYDIKTFKDRIFGRSQLVSAIIVE